MTRRTCLLLVAVAAMWLASLHGASAAAADVAFSRPPAPPLIGPLLNPLFLGGYRSNASLYSLGHIPVPPYFALHPPVYYGLPIRRPYGLSPFAWPGDYLPAPAPPAPLLIENPLAAPVSDSDEAPQASQTAGGPQLILNPYCQQPDEAPGQVASFAGAEP